MLCGADPCSHFFTADDDCGGDCPVCACVMLRCCPHACLVGTDVFMDALDAVVMPPAVASPTSAVPAADPTTTAPRHALFATEMRSVWVLATSVALVVAAMMIAPPLARLATVRGVWFWLFASTVRF